MSGNSFRLILKAYHVLDRLTPLEYDCGALCRGRCCQGDEDTGMLLFPEEDILALRCDRLTVHYDTQFLVDDKPVPIVTCPGTCDRRFRPLACRIFPLFPFVDEAGKIEVRVDPRALPMCPLACRPEYISPAFYRGVRRATRYLLLDPELKEYLLMMSEYLTEIGETARILQK